MNIERAFKIKLYETTLHVLGKTIVTKPIWKLKEDPSIIILSRILGVKRETVIRKLNKDIARSGLLNKRLTLAAQTRAENLKNKIPYPKQPSQSSIYKKPKSQTSLDLDSLQNIDKKQTH